MSSSDYIREDIQTYFNNTGVTTLAKDWKRVFKKSINGQVVREFHNSVVNRTVYVLGEDGDEGFAEKDQWIYGIADSPDGKFLSFESLDRWNRNKYLYDQHLSEILEVLFNLPKSLTQEEDMENTFNYLAAFNDLTIHILLKKAGFQYSAELSNFLSNETGAGPVLPPVAPVNPPTPPAILALNPTPPTAAPKVVKPAPSSPSSTLKRASDFVAVVYEDDDEVLVAITPMMELALGQSYDREVSSIAGHLLPSDWDEVSEGTFAPGGLGMVEAFDLLMKAGFQMNWKSLVDELKDVYRVYDVDAATHKANMDALANTTSTPVAHQVNPLQTVSPNNTGYPELTGQEEPVQQALVAARSKGVLGLEQEGKWDDLDELSDKWSNDHWASSDYLIEIERSHALWLLYEEYDNGSGLAMPNFFGMDNIRLGEELTKILPFKDELLEEDGEVEVGEDNRDYPSPYDLPVPEYVPPPVVTVQPTIQTTRPAPKTQRPVVPKISVPITGSGSFAPVSVPVAKADDKDYTPIDAKYIRFDSGEQWPEFCGAVWENFKAHGPGSIEWVDRFRPRHARIVGIGYKFDRVEYTGIRVQMGYLNEKFEIIGNIDIPGSVFEELLSEFGGEWNDDDNIQFINKRKGEDPETGFSYSSQNLWDEIEPLLKSAGWLPAK